MRISRKGDIQCRNLQVVLDQESWRTALQSSHYVGIGIKDQIAKEIGIEIELEDDTTFRKIEETRNSVLVDISDRWAPPTRR